MKHSLNDHILSLIWLIFLIFPNNYVFFIFVPLVYLVFFDKNKKIDKTTSHYLLILPILLFITFIFNINETYLNFFSIARVAVLILLFFSFGKLKGGKILSPYIIFAIFFLVCSQFSGILNFEKINSFIYSYYVYESESIVDKNSSFEMQNFGFHRLGGIYFNSNNYASYLELILIVLLCEIKQFKKSLLLILFPLIGFSIFATGSRTSFIVLVVLTLFYLYSTKKLFRVKSLFLVIVSIASFSLLNIDKFRILKIDEGVDDSIGVKFRILRDYFLSDPPLLKLLFGNLSGSAMMKYTGSTFVGTDFEIGNLIVYFGYIFFITILLFYISIYKRYLPRYRVVFIILLWMFSNSILLSYRMSAVWMLVLGLYYYRSKTEKNLINEK